MNNATELTDKTSHDETTYSKPYLISSIEQQPSTPYVMNSMTWEDEVEKIVVLCNN